MQQMKKLFVAAAFGVVALSAAGADAGPDAQSGDVVCFKDKTGGKIYLPNDTQLVWHIRRERAKKVITIQRTDIGQGFRLSEFKNGAAEVILLEQVKGAKTWREKGFVQDPARKESLREQIDPLAEFCPH